jgi:hypothetical protein
MILRRRADSAGRAQAPLLAVGLNIFAAVLFIRSGAADALWQCLTPNVPWRTGPVWSAALAYSLVLFGLHASINIAAARRTRIEHLLLHGIRFVAGCCFLVAAQVLMPMAWPAALGAGLLLLMAGEGLIARAAQPLARMPGIAGVLGIWMWMILGLACSRWIISPWTFGSPQHLPRIALLMTFWLLPLRMRYRDELTLRMLMWVPNFASAPTPAPDATPAPAPQAEAITAAVQSPAPPPAPRT